MTNADSISEKLCQAIELIAEKKVSTANYDRTIQATIVSCQDESIGKYKVRYQDGYWYAYGSNIENTYSKGELVYILVPGGDMNNDKTILGSTTRMATNLTTVVNETDRFIPIGNNALPESSYELCSYFNEPVPLHPVYIRGAEGDIGSYLTLTIDAQIKEYISRGTVVDIGFTARTNLPPQQKSAGNYGLLMNLIFKDPATEELIKREYVLDVDNMQGNPYNLITETFQHKYYDIDGANFEYIDSIYLFVQDFPEHYDTKPDDKPYDIFIKNLYFNSAELMSEQDYNSNSLVILTPKGYIFNDTDLGSDARRLQAQVRVKGKIVSENNPDLSFYWFRENSGINAANPKFSTYGKQGWECLNDHVPNKIPYEYVKGKSYYDVLKEVCYTKETKFKCVAVYGETVLSKEITIINNDADYTIILTTDSGKTAFPENSSESPVIICNVDPVAAPSGSHYVYDWCYYDSSLVYHTILKDAATDGNITNLNTLKDFIDNNLTATDTFNYTTLKYQFEEAEIELLDGKTIDMVFAENSIAKNENITYGEFTEIPSTPSVSTAAITLGMAIYNRLYQDERSSGNEVHNVHIPNIVNYRIYKCSVFVSSTLDDSSKIYIGTAALRIINGIDELDIDITTNKLIIENGTQVFKYNTAGVSPCAKSNKNPYQIPNLNLLIYDHEGNDITTEALRTSVIVWRVPVKHTLLDFSNTGYTLIPDPNDEDYAYIRNEPSLAYGISNKYYMNYSNNTIYVAVDYDDETLMGVTNLTFLKEGISGTNGTEYSINIIFANTNDRIPYPTIYYYDNNNISCNWKNSLPRADENWFKVQLWHNGGEQPIFEGAATGNATDTDDPTSTENTVTVRWRVLFRSYPDATINHFINCSSLDDGDFSSVPYFNLDTTKITQYWNLVDGGDSQSLKQNAPANLIQVKVTYKGLDYYDVLPILFSRVASGDTSYKIDLQEGTGFTEVLFDTNGTTREFDNTNPFSIQVGGGQESDFSYQFTPVGSVRYFTSSTQTAAYTDIDYLIPTGRLDELPANQKRYEPCNRYDGQATNIGLICQIKRNNTIFGTLLIPVYFYINRYFNSALNGWDGNSIDLGQTNGGMILAPQVGAGYKEEDNSFTGVVIGTAQDPQARIESESSAFTDRRRIEAGLFGYNKGTRSIFLDAKTGKAEFGAGDGRIILDPSMDRALLFNDGYREVNNGIAQDALGKIDYSYTGQGQGLKIDLTKPEIKYGNGKFAVDQNGNITSMSGHIGGWKITEHTLESDDPAVDQQGRPLYDNEGEPVSAIYLDSLQHIIRGGTLISNDGYIGGWKIKRHTLESEETVDLIDADGNIVYGEDDLPIQIPKISLNSDTQTIKGGTIESNNYYEKTDAETGKVIDRVGTKIDLNNSQFWFADNSLYYEDDVLYVKSLAGGNINRIKEILTASGYSLNARGKAWKKYQKDRDRGYILINNPYLQKNPDRPQEAYWIEPYHRNDGEGQPSQEQKDPNSKAYDGGPHYGSLVYGEDKPKSKETANYNGHVYRMTWDAPNLLFYIDGQLVSTLGMGSYLGVPGDIPPVSCPILYVYYDTNGLTGSSFVITMTNGTLIYSQTVTSPTGGIQQSLGGIGTWQVTISDGTHTSHPESVVVTEDKIYYVSVYYYSPNYYFGYDLVQGDSNPDQRVSYPSDVDNANYAPAYMDFENDVFNYGDWTFLQTPGMFFMPRPVMLGFGGEVKEYLDPNDYNKTVDGTGSQVENQNFDANAMMQWPKIYVKRTYENGVYSFRCSNVRLDSAYDCLSNYNDNNDIVDNFYTGIYPGTVINYDIMRSLSRKNYSTNTMEAMRSFANANGAGWEIETFCDRLLIQDLLVLISKSTNTQAKFGNGANGNVVGEISTKGLFYGKNSNSPIKVFGIQHFWNTESCSKRVLGLVLDHGILKVKLTKNTHDGSTVINYNTTGEGYIQAGGITGNSDYYITEMSYNAKTKYIRLPCSTLNGSSNTYECDWLVYANDGIYPAVMGDGWSRYASERTGAFATVLNQSKNSNTGAVLSYRKSTTISHHISCRSDAIVNSAGIISQNNGSRTPITKVNSGFAIGCLSTNIYTTDNWVGTILISTSRDAILLSVPNVSVPYRRSFYYQGICLWITWQSSNSYWGGATEISSPIGLPITDLPLGTNANMDYPPQENIQKIMQFLQVQVS